MLLLLFSPTVRFCAALLLLLALLFVVLHSGGANPGTRRDGDSSRTAGRAAPARRVSHEGASLPRPGTVQHNTLVVVVVVTSSSQGLLS